MSFVLLPGSVPGDPKTAVRTSAPMKSLSVVITTAIAVAIPAYADFYPIPLTPGSFNQDVVVEKTASPPAQTLVTANMDAGTNVTGTVGGTGGNHGAFYEIGFGTTAGTGLPYHGAVFLAVSNAPGTNHVFQMPPDYKTNNAVFIGGSGSTAVQVPSGAFTLTTPAAFTHLSVLGAAGDGPPPGIFNFFYTHGDQDAEFFHIHDLGAKNKMGN